jgi:hypothetical protein
MLDCNQSGMDVQGRPKMMFARVWSGRALQEVFVDLANAVLHQCIRPPVGACCAPGHHGYQRACDVISERALADLGRRTTRTLRARTS